MARGFGATLGVGTTDKIVSGLTAHATQRTYAMWTYRHGTGGGTNGRIFEKRVSGAEVELLRVGGTNYVYNRWWTTGGVWSIALPTADVWHHIVLTYDGGSTANDPLVYYDKVSQTVTRSTAPTGTLATNTDAYVIGNRASDSLRNWDGSLAEYVVYDSIFTQAKINILCDQGPWALDDVPAIYLPMYGDDSPEPDLGPNNYDGTVTGTAKQIHPVATGARALSVLQAIQASVVY